MSALPPSATSALNVNAMLPGSVGVAGIHDPSGASGVSAAAAAGALQAASLPLAAQQPLPPPPSLTGPMVVDMTAQQQSQSLNKKKPGRSPSQIWLLLTDEPNPQRKNAAACKHCKQQVLYYKKSEQAIRHLKKCTVFQSSQHQYGFITQFQDILPLYQQKITQKVSTKKRLKQAAAAAAAAAAGSSHSTSASSNTTSGASNHANAMGSMNLGVLGDAHAQAAAAAHHHANAMNTLAMQQGMADTLMESAVMSLTGKDDHQHHQHHQQHQHQQLQLQQQQQLQQLQQQHHHPKDKSSSSSVAGSVAIARSERKTKSGGGALPKLQQERLEEALAMHAYVTGMSFDAMEEAHFQRAMGILRSSAKIPDKKKLESELLLRCYDKMYKRVWGYLTASSTRVCIKRDAWSNTNLFYNNSNNNSTATAGQPPQPSEDGGGAAGGQAGGGAATPAGAAAGGGGGAFVTFMAVNSEKRFFLESEKVSDPSADAPYNSMVIAQDIKRVMAPIVHSVSGVVTGSTEFHARAWEMLKVEFPTKFFYGCITHALHLAIMDIFGPELSMENDPRQMTPQIPMDFPFHDLVAFTNNCHELISFFSNFQYSSTSTSTTTSASSSATATGTSTTGGFKATFDAQTLQTMRNFASGSSSSSQTMQWGCLAAKFRVLLQSEDILHEIVSDSDFLTEAPHTQKHLRQCIKDFILDVNWKMTLEKAINILQPIELILYKFQDDKAPISEVYFESKHLLLDFDAVFGLSPNELEYIKKVVTERLQYVLGEAHGLAFLLDPRYIGKSMTREYREQVEELIFNFPETDADMGINEERKRAILAEYTDYVIYAKNQRANHTFKWEMLEKGTRTPLQFWQAEADEWPHLKQLAFTLFSLAPSSLTSSVCKNAITASVISCGKKNKLNFDDLRRLAFITINDSQFTPATTQMTQLAHRISGNAGNGGAGGGGAGGAGGGGGSAAAAGGGGGGVGDFQQNNPLSDFTMGDPGLTADGMMMWMI